MIKKTDFSKTFRYFFLVVSRLFRRVLKTFSEKTRKKNVKNFEQPFFFSDFFDFLSKKVNFSKIIQYFLLVVSRPLRRVFKTFSEKNSKKIKKIKFFKKFRTTFFFSIFFDFLSKKVNLSKAIQYFVKASKSRWSTGLPSGFFIFDIDHPYDICSL